MGFPKVWYHNISIVVFYQYSKVPAELTVISTGNVSEPKHLAMPFRFAWTQEGAPGQHKVVTGMKNPYH